MSWYFYLFILIFTFSPLYSNYEKVGVIDELEGNVTINPAKTALIPSTAIAGRIIYNGDIIHSDDNGRIQFSLFGTDNKVTLFGLSELRINKGNSSYQLELNYGNLFGQFSKDTNFGYAITTQSSNINLESGELWITRDFTNEDQIFSILGNVQAANLTSDEQINIEMGEMVISNLDSLKNKIDINEEMLPSEIFKHYQINREEEKEDIVFTVMNYFSEDSIIISTFQSVKERQRRFNFTLETGVVSVEKNSYGKASLLPMYNGDRLKFGYNLVGFIGISDSVGNLNLFSTLAQILAPLTLKYQSKNRGYKLRMGHINNLTFGYGMLLKRYTNTISYPLKQEGGLLFDFQSGAGNYTFKLFTSSFGELANSGGLVGMYSSIAKLPYRLGVGVVSDLNQFSSVPDSIWNGVAPRKRSISGYQIDFTYELKSDLRNDTYLFGEFTALNYPNDLRYIRSEPIEGDTLDTKQGFERQSSFGITGPGIWWKIGHHRNIKIAFTYSSSLHIAPFFGETYNLERIHYIPTSILDTLDTYKLYSIDKKWNTMITENHIDSDSTAYYLPKDVYALLDPTKNVHNKMGFYAEYNYHFRNYYNYSFDISVMNEIGGNDSSATYYSLGMEILIHEGLIRGISEFSLYFNQNFTSELFNTSDYNENMVIGASLGIKLMENVSLRMYRHDVFYDRNLDGKVNLNSTVGAGLVAKF
ncbi:MAG: hypothetical protein H8E85_06960 [Candidatus Marinimicrobia bacterium]|nr:hypothetical protein [Candidatus Neomarinimicrobiota bacterium]